MAGTATPGTAPPETATPEPASPPAASADTFDLVHARLLRFFPDLVTQLGGDPDPLLASVGLDPAAFGQGHGDVTYRQMVNLLEQAATALACPDFGMRLAMRQEPGDMPGPLGQVMRHSRTFGDALDYVSGHAYAHSRAARIRLRRSADAGAVFVPHEILLDRIHNKAQAMEQILLLGHLGAMGLTGGRARARQVRFRHERVSPARLYRRHFGCEVLFGQAEDGVLFAARDLACAIVAPDALAYRTAADFIDARFVDRRPPLHAEVRGVVMRLLASEDCGNDRVAAELHLHPRTLHRRLGAEGTSFQQVKDEVRRDLMLYYLRQTRFDLARISEKLGFAEQSVMTRRCHHWFAATPTQVRAHGITPHPA